MAKIYIHPKLVAPWSQVKILFLMNRLGAKAVWNGRYVALEAK